MVTHVPYHTVNYWAKIGLVKPSVSPANGSGSRRVYDEDDLVAIGVAVQLRRAGIFAGKTLSPILHAIRNAGFTSPAKVAVTLVPGGQVFVSSSSEQFSSRPKVPKTGQLSFNVIFDCRSTAEHIRERLHALDHGLQPICSATPRARANQKAAKPLMRPEGDKVFSVMR